MQAVTNLIIGNWKSEDWTIKTFNQKGDDGVNITTGKTALGTRAVEFSCSVHTPSKEVYPNQTNAWAACSNVAHAALFFPHKALTSIGNGMTAVYGAGSGLFSAVKNWSDAEFETKAAFSPALQSAKQMLIDGSIALVGIAAWTGNYGLYGYGIGTEYFGYNFAQVVSVALVGAALFHGVHNPQGYQRTLHNRVEKLVDRAPITDSQNYSMSWIKRGFAVLDGSYSLARMLKLNYMGREDTKLSGVSKFEVVEKKSK